MTAATRDTKFRAGADFPGAKAILPPRLLEVIASLHRELETERKELLLQRRLRQVRYDRGEVPTFSEEHPAHTTEWSVAPIPEDLLDRRVEITGPANSAKMVIQMLNGTPDGVADTAMIDFEDSMKPSWENVVSAVHNVIGVARRELVYEQDGKRYELRKSDIAHPMVRVRGLHLDEIHLTVDGQPVAAGLFDLATVAFQTADLFLKDHRTPKYYVPKCEHHLEARWWNRLFSLVEKHLSLQPGALRATFLIETLPAAFQMTEILWEIRSRACGLNGGRWDKIFSDIKVLRNHPDRVLADRATITMQSPWMEAYAKLLIKTCHSHGAFAMGGMAAFTPGKTEELRKVQAEKVRADKAREASIGHDGCWVSHPYFIPIARAEFKRVNQLDVRLDGFPKHPDLLPRADGPKTMKGLRTNLRVAIGYTQGWNAGLGCVALDNLMEDLATLEISRAQTWQWVRHGVRLEDGTAVTRALVERVFEEELEGLLKELPADESLRRSFVEAKELAVQVFTQPELAEFFDQALVLTKSPAPNEEKNHEFVPV
jgi:malate synthase